MNVYVMAQTSPPKVWIMKRPSVQAGPPSWRTEVQAGPRKKHTIVAAWLPDAAQDHLTCANGQQKFGSRERNEYLSLPMHGETVGGHTIKHSINLTFLYFQQPTCPAWWPPPDRAPSWLAPTGTYCLAPTCGAQGPQAAMRPAARKAPKRPLLLQTHNRRA